MIHHSLLPVCHHSKKHFCLIGNCHSEKWLKSIRPVSESRNPPRKQDSKSQTKTLHDQVSIMSGEVDPVVFDLYLSCSRLQEVCGTLLSLIPTVRLQVDCKRCSPWCHHAAEWPCYGHPVLAHVSGHQNHWATIAKLQFIKKTNPAVPPGIENCNRFDASRHNETRSVSTMLTSNNGNPLRM